MGAPPSILQIAEIRRFAAPSTFIAGMLLALLSWDAICVQLYGAPVSVFPTLRADGMYWELVIAYAFAMSRNGIVPPVS